MNIRDFQNEIVVGSAAFFSGMEGYAPKTIDKLEIITETRNGWWRYCGHADGVSHYKWQQHTLGELVEKLRKCTDCKRVTTLLVPEFAQAVGCDNAATYLVTIQPAIDKLCDKHEWGKTVYAAYVENGALTLTAEQREAAYEQYKALRPDNRNGGGNPSTE